MIQNVDLLWRHRYNGRQQSWRHKDRLFPRGFYGRFLSTITDVEDYSGTTWAVGIAQLTHHSVRGGGKNPSTFGLRIFSPTLNLVVVLLSHTLFE